MTGTANWPSEWLEVSLAAAIGLLLVGALLCLARAGRGPRQPDRMAALALVYMIAVAIMAVLAVVRADWRFLDIALVLAVLSGAVPIAFARAARRDAEAPPSSEEKAASHVVGD
jgi:multisubunit Na+/H+ antiporter MnhF subunit